MALSVGGYEGDEVNHCDDDGSDDDDGNDDDEEDDDDDEAGSGAISSPCESHQPSQRPPNTPLAVEQYSLRTDEAIETHPSLYDAPVPEAGGWRRAVGGGESVGASAAGISAAVGAGADAGVTSSTGEDGSSGDNDDDAAGSKAPSVGGGYDGGWV